MNEAIYCRNLEAVVLLDGKDIDITEITDKLYYDTFISFIFHDGVGSVSEYDIGQ